LEGCPQDGVVREYENKETNSLTTSRYRVLLQRRRTVRSAWVYRGGYGSASDCASYCAASCGIYVQSYSNFRGGVFGSAGNSRSTLLYNNKKRPFGRFLLLYDFQDFCRNICDWYAYLVHCVAVTQCNGAVFDCLVVNRYTYRCSNFIVTTVIFTDITAVF